MQSGMPQTNTLKSVGYTDTVLFWTIGKPDVYQQKNFGKSEQFFIRVFESLKSDQ
jgi:hypothetical protein